MCWWWWGGAGGAVARTHVKIRPAQLERAPITQMITGRQFFCPSVCRHGAVLVDIWQAKIVFAHRVEQHARRFSLRHTSEELPI